LSADRDWFLEQVRREQTRLRAYTRSLGVRAESVDDIAQDALIIALQKLNEFDRSGDFGAWIRQIAKRLVANERRKESRRQRLLSEHVTDLLLEMGDAEITSIGRQVRKEELAALRDCLAELPARGREILSLRYLEGISPGAIASQLGQPSNRVRQTLLRLRRVLAACIERRLGMEPL
jgi:RNA polymerase sigma-70 factor (ECF subfamily)